MYWGMHYYILRNINNDAFINTSLLTLFLKILLTRLNEIVTWYAREVNINEQLKNKLVKSRVLNSNLNEIHVQFEEKSQNLDAFTKK